ncbi:MAG: glycogen synthase GlgA [Betaproteobacteria bacterium]
MRSLFVTPECAPLTKTGGLGDVSAALPAALRALGLEVRVLLPGYTEVLDGIRDAVEVARLGESRVLEAGHFLVLDNPRLYRRDGGPYLDAAGRDWPDNALRFGELCRAAATLAGARPPLSWKPDVVHCNDWPSGLVPVYLADAEHKAATVMTVHNLAFQGLFDASLLAVLGVPAARYSLDGLEFHGRMSFLKGGLAYADAITTVSPTYAREILTPEHGCGLDGFLRTRAAILSGIANGIDTAVWNPESDRYIARPFGKETLERKSENKLALQARMRLAPDPDTLLFGMVARLTPQKGIDLVLALADRIPGQLAVLGAGARELEDGLQAAAARHAGRIGFIRGFDEALAHAIEAGADAFLMPSRFEPSGLNQMYSQRYGTLPVARATGGLADTILDGETGFLFHAAEPAALGAAIGRAAEVYAAPQRWRRMQRDAMTRDFSWAAPARRYAALYSRLASAVAA